MMTSGIHKTLSLVKPLMGYWSLIGYDNDTQSRLMDPPLTTIDHPIYELGVQGTKSLLEILNQNSSSKKEFLYKRLPVSLISRNSVKKINL